MPDYPTQRVLRWLLEGGVPISSDLFLLKMDTQQYGKLFSFIWNIANDVLVHAFEKGDYKKIILPFTALRRIDVLLEATKPQVAAKKAFCDQNKLPCEAFLPQVTGYPFYNTSAFTMSTLKNEIDPQRHIIENDMLEAIIAMPEKDFYNTGIGTYIWIVTNRKEARRKGKVQLIDATSIKTPLRKNLGEKNCETNGADRKKILDLLMAFEENEYSKIFPNQEFGYWEVELFKPAKDEDGNVIKDKKGRVKMAKVKGEVEQIPFTYPGGIEAFYEQEVKPYDAEAEFGEPIIGYELSFTKYFYKPVQLRTLDAIMEDIRSIERNTDGLLDDIMK